MSRPQDPWGNWPGQRDKWAFRALVAIITVWTVAVGAGLLGYIVGKLQGA